MRRGCNDSWDGLTVPFLRFPSFKCKKRRQMEYFCSFSCPRFPPVCLLDSSFFSVTLFIPSLPSFSSLLLPPGLTVAPEGNDRRERGSSTLIQMRVHETIKEGYERRYRSCISFGLLFLYLSSTFLLVVLVVLVFFSGSYFS